MGVNKLLQAGIASEREQLSKAQKATPPKIVEVPPTEITTPLAEHPAKKDKVVVKPNKKKSQGGRPTNKEKGIASRKQYTLTLKEEDYQFFLEKAGQEDLSFAKFMEKAAKEYIENHRI